jgi:hypothetical protein
MEMQTPVNDDEYKDVQIGGSSSRGSGIGRGRVDKQANR